MPITSTEQLTPEYLTGRLRGGGFLDRGRVTSVDVKLTKKLHVSVVSRLEIGYSADATLSAPGKLFLKMSGPDVFGDAGIHGEKEVEFYLAVAGEMPDPPFIRCYDATFSRETNSYHLLLEDLTDTHFQPVTPSLPTEAQSRDAVASLAELHAFWREHPRLGRDIGKLTGKDELNSMLDGIEKNVAAFTDFMGDKLSREGHRIYERLIASRYDVWGRLTDPKGLTVTHGDTHWWNFLYPHGATRHRVCIFDWQLWHIDVGARDLAFLVALGGFAERRPTIERGLVDCYYDSLIAQGVGGYSRDDLWNDYRWAALRNLNIPIVFWSQGKAEPEWTAMLERAMDSFEDLKLSELLGG